MAAAEFGLYVLLENGAIWRTPDSGKTWYAVRQPWRPDSEQPAPEPPK